MQQPAAKERRGALRARSHLYVRVNVGTAQQLLAVENLSKQGLFLATEHPLEPGSAICVEFSLPGRDRVAANGRVVWMRRKADDRGPAGMGIELAPLDDWDQALLGELVEQALFG
ncbi:MAG: PilZ domain-containing protein [Myxococcota bacterium]